MVLCKVLGRTFTQDFLQIELKKFLKREGRMEIISLGKGFFTVKCSSKAQKLSILAKGPCFVLNHLVAVQQWMPGFQPLNANNHYSVWIHLPEFPMEFYSKSVLEKIGNNLGQTVKINIQKPPPVKARI